MQENLFSGFLSMSYQNQPAQLQRQAIIVNLHVASLDMIHSNKGITKALTRLCRCADWSAPLLFENLEGRLSCIKAHLRVYMGQFKQVVWQF